MPGAQPRKSYEQRVGSSVRRQAPVGLGTPGAFRVRRRPDNTERDIAAAGLSDLGFWRIDSAAYVGTVMGSGLETIAPDGVEVNTLSDPGWVSYSAGVFHVLRAGLWVIQADVRVDTMPDGYIHLKVARDGFGDAGPNIPFISGGGEIIANGASQPSVSFGDDYWAAQTVLNAGGPVVTSAYVVIYPIALF